MTPPALLALPRWQPPAGAPESLAAAEFVLARQGLSIDAIPGAAAATGAQRQAAAATALMDEYRRTGSARVFDSLIGFVGHQLLARVRSRLRFLGAGLDPHEILQDTIINIFRYPDRFDACRPGAFAAWSSTIIDNTIRRQMRRQGGGLEISLSPAEVLSQHPDRHEREPALQAQDQEEEVQTLAAFSVLLQVYLAAFHRLSDRERFVLQMVEVQRLRYTELANMLGIRPEALKMVVFRARKRIYERMAQWLQRAAAAPASAARA